jgi:hypothetical protein
VKRQLAQLDGSGLLDNEDLREQRLNRQNSRCSKEAESNQHEHRNESQSQDLRGTDVAAPTVSQLKHKKLDQGQNKNQ